MVYKAYNVDGSGCGDDYRGFGRLSAVLAAFDRLPVGGLVEVI